MKKNPKKPEVREEIPKRRLSERGKSILKYIAFFAGGALIASFFWYIDLNSTVSSIAAQVSPLRENSTTYQFIDPLLGYSLPNNVKQFQEYAPIQNDINNLIASEGASAPDMYGIYFRDLSSGRWAGVNDDVSFAPGSLMKVVLMIAYYEEAQTNPSILQQKLVYTAATADQLNGVPFVTPSDLQVGQSYTVEQLIESMIEESDNGAKNALLDNIDSSSLTEIMTDLGLPSTDLIDNYANYAITPKEYSVLLRVLYNATYLDQQYSEQALSILSQAEYDQGLVAGVPVGTPVAQKFGESVATTTVGTTQITLSNCGIVYYPNDPYVLCVMTRGESLPDLTQTIASISQTVWNDVKAYSS